MTEEELAILRQYIAHNQIEEGKAGGSGDNLIVNGERITLPPVIDMPHWVEGGSRFAIVEGKR